MWKQRHQSLETESFKIIARTHRGHTLPKNEDRFFIKTLKDQSILCAVADGLGGESKGDYASELVIKYLSKIDELFSSDSSNELFNIALNIDRIIHKEGERSSKLHGTGSTLTGILLNDFHLHWVHAGDSRLYLFRENGLIQVTEDQTRARFLLNEGEITADQFISHYSRHIMDQYLGCGFCEPETGSFALKPKDRLIITTDGLHKNVDYNSILSAVRTSRDMNTIAKVLEHRALQKGGDDNITVIGIKVLNP